PANRYLRILVVGSGNAPVAEIIERELDFRTILVEQAAVKDAMRNSADIGAVVASPPDIDVVMRVRSERGLRMPVFLLTTRDHGTLAAPYLKSLGGVVIADVE